MVFTALTNCFRKNFIDFLSFAFICYTFVAQQLSLPKSKMQKFFFGGIDEPRQFLQLLSNVSYDVE